MPGRCSEKRQIDLITRLQHRGPKTHENVLSCFRIADKHIATRKILSNQCKQQTTVKANIQNFVIIESIVEFLLNENVKKKKNKNFEIYKFTETLNVLGEKKE